MKWLKKNMILLVALIVYVAAVAGLSYMEWSARTELGKTKAEEEAAKGKLTALVQSAIAPTSNNEKTAKTNVAALKEEFAELASALPSVTEDRSEIDKPLKFSDYLQTKYLEPLRRHARELQPPITLPPDFAFGFSSYVSNFPAEADIQPLLRQMEIAEELITDLMDSKVLEIISIKRVAVEQALRAPAVPSVGTTTGSADIFIPEVKGSSPVYEVMPFEFVFVADVDALQLFLNLLVESYNDSKGKKRLYLVRDLSVETVAGPVKQGVPTAVPAPAPGRLAPAERVIVEGTEKVKVFIRVDWVQVRGPQKPVVPATAPVPAVKAKSAEKETKKAIANEP